MKELELQDFLSILSKEEADLAAELDGMLIKGKCAFEIKEAASGYTVSYKADAAKKTIACFVCRKTGLKIRFTPLKPFECDEFLNALPEDMKKDMLRANVCKRLMDDKVCNPRCLTGYAYTLDGKPNKKCRAMAFLFNVKKENMPYLLKFTEKVLGA